MTKKYKNNTKSVSHRVDSELVEKYNVALHQMPLDISAKDMYVGYMKFVISQINKFQNSKDTHILNYSVVDGSVVLVDPQARVQKISICDSERVINE